MFEFGKDIKYTPNPNHIHVKSEFLGPKYQTFVEQPETMATDRKFISLINENTDYNILNCGDLSCKENYIQLMLKKEALNEVGFQPEKQKKKTGGNRQKKQEEIKQKYTCNLCDSSFTERFHLDAHFNIFHGDAELLVSVGDQNKESSTGNSIDINEENGNPQRKSNQNILFVCYTCNAKFSKKNSLDMHIDLIHNVPNSPNLLICLFCRKPFHEQVLLDKHILRYHPSWRPLTCNICGDTFALLKTLNEHQTTFHNDVYANYKVIQNDGESENVVRLNYTDCSTADSNINYQGRLVLTKRRKTLVSSKGASKGNFGANKNFENNLERRKYIRIRQADSHTLNGKNSILHGKNSEHVDTACNEVQEEIEESHRKRRKIEHHSNAINRDFQQLYQYECVQCQLQIISLNSLFRHVDECPKKVMQLDSSSIENRVTTKGDNRRNIQLDCRRMGGPENCYSFGNNSFCDKSKGRASEITNMKQALMEKIFNSETTKTNQLTISCGYCEFTTRNFTEFNDHLMLHGI